MSGEIERRAGVDLYPVCRKVRYVDEVPQHRAEFLGDDVNKAMPIRGKVVWSAPGSAYHRQLNLLRRWEASALVTPAAGLPIVDIES